MGLQKYSRIGLLIYCVGGRAAGVRMPTYKAGMAALPQLESRSMKAEGEPGRQWGDRRTCSYHFAALHVFTEMVSLSFLPIPGAAGF